MSQQHEDPDNSTRFWLAEDQDAEIGTDWDENGEGPNTESFLRISNKLEAEKDARREERFVFCLIILILLNVLFFTSMDNWGGPVVIGVFEALLLTIAALRWGLDEIVLIIDRFIGVFSGRK